MRSIRLNQILLKSTVREYMTTSYLIFEKNILNTLNEIEELLYCVNDIELFKEMVDLIYRFKFRLRELENQMKFLDDEKILLSQNISYILDEMSKFKEII